LAKISASTGCTIVHVTPHPASIGAEAIPLLSSIGILKCQNWGRALASTVDSQTLRFLLAVKLEGSGKSHDGEQERKDLHFKINPFSVTKITVPATI